MIIAAVTAGIVALFFALSPGTTSWRTPLVIAGLLCAPLYLWERYGPVRLREGRRWYVTTDGGLLVWGRRAKPEVLRWSQIRTAEPSARSGVRIVVRSAPGVRVPAVCGRRSLIAALRQGRPVTWPRRIAGQALTGALAVVAAWFVTGPMVAGALFGDRPVTVDGMSRICMGGSGYGRGAAFQGSGPHPAAIFESRTGPAGGPEDYFLKFSEAGNAISTGDLNPRDVQLVVCSRVVGYVGDEIDGCGYAGGYGLSLVQGHWRVDVYAVKTRREVLSFTIDGDRNKGDFSCPPSLSGGSDFIYTSPGADYASPLTPLITGVAGN